MDDVLQEMDERRNKEKNIVIFNLDESDSNEEDLSKTVKIIKYLNAESVEINNINVQRLGKTKIDNKCRPLKVMLNSSKDVYEILKNCKKLKNYPVKSNIIVNRDLTMYQRNVNYNIRKDFKSRKENGESNIILVYRKGFPKIIKVNEKNE